MCELCESTATMYDADLCMWLCAYDYASFNGATESIELSDAEWDM